MTFHEEVAKATLRALEEAWAPLRTPSPDYLLVRSFAPRLVLVTGIQRVELGIPYTSIRGPFYPHLDIGWVDHRCLKRYKRRATLRP